MSRRRRQSGAPDIAGRVPPTNRADSMPDLFTDVGASQFFDARFAAPRSSVHRLIESLTKWDSYSDDKNIYRRLAGYGAASPMQASRVRYFGVPVGGIGRQRRPMTKPTPASAFLSSYWHGFNTLQTRNPAKDSHCVHRHKRRSVLFARKIAGPNRRRSPGRGGSYQRTVLSQWGC